MGGGGGLEALGIQTQGLGVAGAQLPAKCSAQDEPCWGLVIEAIGFLKRSCKGSIRGCMLFKGLA